MRQFFTTAFFIVLVFQAFAQRIETIPGEYVFKEKIGLHSDGLPLTLGNLSYLPGEPIVDTTILHKLCLNNAHGAFLERDTSFRTLYVKYGPYQQWIGNWQLDGDSLVVVFDHLIVIYPFTLPGRSSTWLEKLSEPLTMIFFPDEVYPVMHKLNLPDYRTNIFEREEYE